MTSHTSSISFIQNTTLYAHVRSRDANDNQSGWSATSQLVLNATNCPGTPALPTFTPTPPAPVPTVTPIPTVTSTPTPTNTPQSTGAVIVVSPIELPDDSPIRVNGDKILKISVTLNGEPALAFASRTDNGIVKSLGATDDNGNIYTTLSPDGLPILGNNSVNFSATVVGSQSPSVSTIFSYSSSGEMIFQHTLNRDEALLLGLNALLRETIDIGDPSLFIRSEFWSNVVGFIQLAFEFFTDYQPQAGDIVSVEAYQYTIGTSTETTIHQCILRIERQGREVLRESYFDKQAQRFIRLAEAGFGGITGSLGSPAHFSLTNPEGLQIGIHPETGQVVNEIPGSYYSGFGTEPQIIAVLNPTFGTYTFTAVGTDVGTIHLDTISFMPSGNTQSQSTVLPIVPNQVVSQTVQYSNFIYLPLLIKQ